MGFDELGEHGMVYGEINEQTKEVKIKFIKLDDTEFCEKEIDVSTINTEEDLLEKITQLNLNENNLYKIILTGKRNYNIDERKIFKLINKENILKIKNNTKNNYNLEEISKEETIKGYFVKEMLEKLEKAENKKIIEDAIEIGLEVLES